MGKAIVISVKEKDKGKRNQTKSPHGLFEGITHSAQSPIPQGLLNTNFAQALRAGPLPS